MIIRYTLAWIVFVVVAIINGAIREAAYKDYFGDLHAHQLSTIAGIVLFGLIVWALSRLWPLESARQACAVGFIWLALTIAFEFLFGHFVMGNPWSSLLHDYNILAGRIWILIPIWITIAPYVFFRIHGKRTA